VLAGVKKKFPQQQRVEAPTALVYPQTVMAHGLLLRPHLARESFGRPIDDDMQFYWEYSGNVYGVKPQPIFCAESSQQSTIGVNEKTCYDDTGAPADLSHLATIESHTTFDGHYVFAGLEDWTMSLSIVNIADEDPPEARGDLAYDPFTHNAFGRLIKLGVTYSMEQ
jgi:hypothetical protein